ncbi:MAG: SRPBCC family protein [Caulobacterales bacterium]|nr:SRPBCC family protein [Caulobacterales bacterium]MCA0371388.1 SRPBCC family protein [Pseudomonadota bacterium]
MGDRSLKIERIIKASPERIWRAITEPQFLEQWFCPKPWFVKDVVYDLRVGGKGSFKICGPNGEEMPNSGVFLAVEPSKRLVSTDAFVDAWIPSDNAFMVSETILEDLGDGTTKYTACAHHWTDEAVKNHKEMGFDIGWGKAADQLEELLASQ